MTTDTWSTVNCPCRDDGPWAIFGPPAEIYHCARCRTLMTVQAACSEPEGMVSRGD